MEFYPGNHFVFIAEISLVEGNIRMYSWRIVDNKGIAYLVAVNLKTRLPLLSDSRMISTFVP